MRSFIVFTVAFVSLILLFLSVWFVMYLPAALALTGAILIHEIGHFIVLKWFKYDSPSMVFVPFLGGFVAHQSTNTPPWRELLMYLAGPLPGLFAGCLLLIFWGGDTSDHLFVAIVMLIALNVFNLLPFEPLDGGKLFKIFLLNRNPILECGSLVATFFFWSLVFDLYSSMAGFVVLVCLGSMIGIATIKKWLLSTRVEEIREFKPEMNELEEDGRRVFVAKYLIENKLSKLEDKSLPDQITEIIDKLYKPNPSILSTITFISVYSLSFLVVYLALMTSPIHDWNVTNFRSFIVEQARWKMEE